MSDIRHLIKTLVTTPIRLGIIQLATDIFDRRECASDFTDRSECPRTEFPGCHFVDGCVGGHDDFSRFTSGCQLLRLNVHMEERGGLRERGVLGSDNDGHGDIAGFDTGDRTEDVLVGKVG